MNIECTGRQFEITPALRKTVENGLNKLSGILGATAKAKAVLTAERQRRKVEITVSRPRKKPLIGLGEASDMVVAIGEALQHIEKQVLKHDGRRRDTKREDKAQWKREAPEIELQMAVGATANTSVPVVVHKFPRQSKTTEAHLIHSQDSVALRPMTIEEAVKECEFRDRDVFVFRTKKGIAHVLHRTREGKLELIEVP